jgi:DNA-binding winged helix-turn-helix (wHTH) protein
MSPEVISMLEPDEPATSDRTLLSSGRYVLFGPFRIDQQRQEVTRDGSRLKLQGKVYQVLLTLLEKPGDVVTREELRVRLWPADTHVNYDANVNTTVNKLRQALGDSSDKPLYIETIPRKGYCFLLQPEVSDESPHSHFAQGGSSADSARADWRFQDRMFGLCSA